MLIKNRNKQAVVFITIIVLSLIIGFRPFEFGTDYESYIKHYNENTIYEPLYYIATAIGLFIGIPPEVYIFIVSVVSGTIYYKAISRIDAIFCYKLLSTLMFWILLMGAHFRSGFALSVFLYFFTLNRNLIGIVMSSMLHYAFLTSGMLLILISVFLRGNKIVIAVMVTLILVAFFSGAVEQIIADIFILFNKERNLSRLHNLTTSYEHRNLLDVYNPKLLLMLIFFAVGYLQRKGNIVLLFLLPPFAYITLGYDAYLAEKTYLATSPLMILGVNGIKNGIPKKFVVLAVLGLGIRDILGRFSIIDLTPIVE